MSISIFYLFDASFISAEKVRWSLLSVRSARKIKHNPFTEKNALKKQLRKSDPLINDDYLQSVKLN